MAAPSPASLAATLKKAFGIPSFRPYQPEPIQALLSSRDTCCYWATGSGKSLVFSLPPLHSNKPAVIISPLISLMQDQCIKLNATVGEGTATFLGTAQMDPAAEAKAARGDFKLVYITPEASFGCARVLFAPKLSFALVPLRVRVQSCLSAILLPFCVLLY